MKCPGLDVLAEPKALKASTELSGRFTGESQGQRVACVGVSHRDPVSNPSCQYAGLT